MVTQDELKDLMHYDPETGVFTWKTASSARVTAGQIAGSKNEQGYICIRIRRRAYKAHRLAVLYMTGAFPVAQTDHVNGTKCDNRWVNLRPATDAQNKMNVGLKSTNTSGFKGVSWDKANKNWRPQCRTGGLRHNLGRFSTAEAAAVSLAEFWRIHHGEFYHQPDATA